MNKSESNPNMKENMLVVVSDFEAEAGAPFIDDKVTARKTELRPPIDDFFCIQLFSVFKCMS